MKRLRMDHLCFVVICGLILAFAIAWNPYESQAIQTFQPDLTVQMSEAYLPNDNLNDDYRCFLIDLGLEEDTFVTSFEILPDQQDLVHHVILFLATPNNVPQAQALDRSESGLGWTCFGGSGVEGAGGSLAGSLGTWVPGASAAEFPAGTGKLVRAGSQVVMQVHYNLNGANNIQPDQSSARLALGRPEEDLAPIQGMTLIAPVEIRCPGPYPTDTSDSCHRQFATLQVQDPRTANSLHQICGTSPNLYIERDIGFGDAQDTQCDILVRQDGLALGASNHMHLRGKSLKIELNPDSPDAQTLLFNENWNFNQQQGIWFETPVELSRGDILRLTCVFDNSSAIPGPDGNPLEPRYLVWGEGTTDEMCLGGINWIRQ